MFLEKLVDPSDPNGIEMEDICQSCNTKYYVKKEENKLKLNI